MKELVAQAGSNASAGSVAEAVAASDVILLATPWGAARAAVESAGDLSGKILIDAVNPLAPRLEGLELGTTTSASEQIAGWARGARVVKSFNTVGANIMENEKFSGGAPVLFYCGDDAEAKRVVHGLAAELGFDARDAGPLKQARVLEPFAMLWISLAVQYGYGRDIAFQFLQR
jgi:predicted dinucleotide-binding enzyme